MKTVYLIREEATGREWWSDCGAEAPGYTVVQSAVQLGGGKDQYVHAEYTIDSLGIQ